jgi:hypothetical protein
MTDQRNDAAKARAEAVLHLPAAKTKPNPLAEYRARQDAERAKMAKLRTQRLVAEAMATREKAKR